MWPHIPFELTADKRLAVARIVHYLRLHLVGKTIKTATAVEDNNVFGKVGTTGADVAAALTGKKVCYTVPVKLVHLYIVHILTSTRSSLREHRENTSGMLLFIHGTFVLV